MSSQEIFGNDLSVRPISKPHTSTIHPSNVTVKPTNASVQHCEVLKTPLKSHEASVPHENISLSIEPQEANLKPTDGNEKLPNGKGKSGRHTSRCSSESVVGLEELRAEIFRLRLSNGLDRYSVGNLLRRHCKLYDPENEVKWTDTFQNYIHEIPKWGNTYSSRHFEVRNVFPGGMLTVNRDFQKAVSRDTDEESRFREEAQQRLNARTLDPLMPFASMRHVTGEPSSHPQGPSCSVWPTDRERLNLSPIDLCLHKSYGVEVPVCQQPVRVNPQEFELTLLPAHPHQNSQAHGATFSRFRRREGPGVHLDPDTVIENRDLGIASRKESAACSTERELSYERGTGTLPNADQADKAIPIDLQPKPTLGNSHPQLNTANANEACAEALSDGEIPEHVQSQSTADTRNESVPHRQDVVRPQCDVHDGLLTTKTASSFTQHEGKIGSSGDAKDQNAASSFDSSHQRSSSPDFEDSSEKKQGVGENNSDAGSTSNRTSASEGQGISEHKKKKRRLAVLTKWPFSEDQVISCEDSDSSFVIRKTVYDIMKSYQSQYQDDDSIRFGIKCILREGVFPLKASVRHNSVAFFDSPFIMNSLAESIIKGVRDLDSGTQRLAAISRKQPSLMNFEWSVFPLFYRDKQDAHQEVGHYVFVAIKGLSTVFQAVFKAMKSNKPSNAEEFDLIDTLGLNSPQMLIIDSLGASMRNVYFQRVVTVIKMLFLLELQRQDVTHGTRGASRRVASKVLSRENAIELLEEFYLRHSAYVLGPRQNDSVLCGVFVLSHYVKARENGYLDAICGRVAEKHKFPQNSRHLPVHSCPDLFATDFVHAVACTIQKYVHEQVISHL